MNRTDDHTDEILSLARDTAGLDDGGDAFVAGLAALARVDVRVRLDALREIPWPETAEQMRELAAITRKLASAAAVVADAMDEGRLA